MQEAKCFYKKFKANSHYKSHWTNLPPIAPSLVCDASNVDAHEAKYLDGKKQGDELLSQFSNSVPPSTPSQVWGAINVEAHGIEYL